MKIAHFTYGILHGGGIRSYVESLSRLQISAGHDVVLFDTTKAGDASRLLKLNIVRDETELFQKCEELSVDILHYHTGPAKPPPQQLTTVYTVHEHSPHCISGGLYLKRSNLPCPRTYTPLGCLHGHVWDRCGSIRPASFIKKFRRMKRQMEILPDQRTICVGHSVKLKMVAAGYPDHEISVVPNFADVDADIKEIPLEGIPEFLFIGRIERLKGLEWLLRSLKLVRAPVLLNIAGTGDGEGQCRDLVKDLGLGGVVRFLGWVDSAAKIELFHSSRAVIIPSIWPEPFGLVAIEAAGCARPSIVSNSGELPFIVEDGKNGIVVDVANIDQLAAAIELLANELDLAQDMGLDSHRKFNDRYTAEVHLRKIEDVYRVASLRRGFEIGRDTN